MADPDRRLPENVSGDFFVDSSCIDCDTCRQIAPATFRDHGGQSSVHRQPVTEQETHLALMALISCPTASIAAGLRVHVAPRRREVLVTGQFLDRRWVSRKDFQFLPILPAFRVRLRDAGRRRHHRRWEL